MYAIYSDYTCHNIATVYNHTCKYPLDITSMVQDNTIQYDSKRHID
jgi:hypothetical protein